MTHEHDKIADSETPFVLRLRQLCGYVENGTDTTLKIYQDDATREWFVGVGLKRYHGATMEEAFEAAFTDPLNNPFA